MARPINTPEGTVDIDVVGGGDVVTSNADGEYATGGVQLQTKLENIDVAQVTVANSDYQLVAAQDASNPTQINVIIRTAEVDTTTSNASEAVSWTELADTTNISSEAFKYTAVNR